MERPHQLGGPRAPKHVKTALLRSRGGRHGWPQDTRPSPHVTRTSFLADATEGTCTHIKRNPPKLGSDGAVHPRGVGEAHSLKQAPSQLLYRVKFGRSATKGVYTHK